MRPQKTHSAQGRLIAKHQVIGARRCGKQCYANKKLAKARAVEARKRTDEPIEAYKCFKCHAYHLGHRPGWDTP